MQRMKRSMSRDVPPGATLLFKHRRYHWQDGVLCNIVQAQELGDGSSHLALVELRVGADLAQRRHVRPHGQDKNILRILDLRTMPGPLALDLTAPAMIAG